MRRLYIFILVILTVNAEAQLSSKVKLLCNWNDTVNVRLNRTGQRYNDIWGFVWKNREYGIIGSTEGVHIIDVSDCRQVAFAAGRVAGEEIIHRDYDTYKNYLYAVCDEGISTLQVFDLSYLPDSIHLVYESNPAELTLSHNVFIDTAKATLYACSAKGTMSGSDHMRVYSIANPEEPVLLTKYNNRDKVHDVYVRNDTAYCSSSFYGYEVIDFTNHSSSYKKIGEMSFYPYQGYNHSSWINPQGIGVMADETHGSPVKIIDTRDLTDLRVISTFSPRPNDTTCIPHNPYIVGNFAYVSYYMDGLQIYDISDPSNPIRSGYYDTYPHPSYKGFAGAWGCYPFLPSGRVLVSDMQTGLYVFDVSEAIRKDDTSSPPPSAQFSIYPNPFTDYVNIVLPKTDTGRVELRIHDVSGKLMASRSMEVFNYTIQPIRLTLPGYWPAGVYFISIKNGAHFYKEKISKR